MPAILRYAGYPVAPWRNGGGVLRSIVEGDGWQVRLADIDASVPFSDYRGYLRHFAIAAGAVVLRFPSGESVACDPGSAVAVYPGGMRYHTARRPGTARAQNVNSMGTRRSRSIREKFTWRSAPGSASSITTPG